MTTVPLASPSIESVFGDLPRIETDRLILRKMRRSDAPDMYEYAKDPEVSRFTIWETHASLRDAERFLEAVIECYKNKEIANWGMELKENGRFIGTCGYFLWVPEHGRAEIQYAVSKAYWGKGLMTEAVAEVIRFGFETMRLNRIEAKCMLANTGSERVMQKMGMKFEGIARECVYAKGSFHDLKMYALLKRDWGK